MDGRLPGKCASMVFPYVPMQTNNPQVYEQTEGLENGTLFPGLNLPFQKEIKARLNCNNAPLCELMALDFAVVELGLYLDTHKEDQEAFEASMPLNMGQLLSIPFVLVGVAVILYSVRRYRAGTPSRSEAAAKR